LSILDHVLGVTGLSLWIGRQLSERIPVDLPLLHGAAIGHDVGKFACVGDEARRIPRLHYYYTHIWYRDRNLTGLGHIATNHSCWDLELVRLPIETLLLVYADFRVKEWPDARGPARMRMISLQDAYDAIRNKLEDLDGAKARRYEGVYRKLRDLEEFLQYQQIVLDPPGFEIPQLPPPRLPEGLDLLSLMAGRGRLDATALAVGPEIQTLHRLLVTAHNLGVMERLRDVPALRTLLEEAHSLERWRDQLTYQAILGEYSPALSTDQKAMALDFFVELLAHPEDDIRYHVANRIGDLFAGEEDFWRKDLPAGTVLRQERRILDELERVLRVLDRAGPTTEEDMGPTERVLYAIPIVLRRLLRQLDPVKRRQVWDVVEREFAGYRGDRRPLVGLYICEALTVSLPYLDEPARARLLDIVVPWADHEATNTRLMCWQVLLALAREGKSRSELLDAVRKRVEVLGETTSERSLVADLFLLEEMAKTCDLPELARRCRDFRAKDRDPLHEVLLRNLKARVGWVEKKVNCDYLAAIAHLRVAERLDPGSSLANEIASHFSNLLKVSRVEGTRFHAGRCLLGVLPILTVPQRNDLMVELLRSLELDAEAVTRYIPRFLGPVLTSLPDQEFLEGLDDIESNVRRGSVGLQRLLLQTVSWILLSLEVDRLRGPVLRRLVAMLLGSLAEVRTATANEGFAQIAMVLERLVKQPQDDGRLGMICSLATKKFLSLITHKPGDRVRFFLVASALNHLDRALARVGRGFKVPARPSVALVPGTFDPFTSAHEAIVSVALQHADEALVQIDEYSWHKHVLPRELREELVWMATAALPEVFLAPYHPPVNLASPEGAQRLRRIFGRRPMVIVVGSDVLSGASAYSKPRAPIWDIRHVVVMREGAPRSLSQERLSRFRRGVKTVLAPADLRSVSSSSLRAALDRREDLDSLCHPLVARTLVERRLYVNYPAQKQLLPPAADRVETYEGAVELPAGLEPVAQAGLADETSDAERPGRRLCAVSTNESLEGSRAALIWREVSAAALPVVIGDERLALATDGRLLGRGALVESIGAMPQPGTGPYLERLLAEAMLRWLDAGLLFAMVPAPPDGSPELREALHQMGASWTPDRDGSRGDGSGWAELRLANPLVMLWDLDTVLQPEYAAALQVRRALKNSRLALAGFFSDLRPGEALLHVHEEQLKRRVVDWARARIAAEPEDRQWVILGLGRQFSRDLVGEWPTVAIEMERFLTWQGYEGGAHPVHGSPAIELQLAVARELGKDALLLVPFLRGPEPVLRVIGAAEAAGLVVRDTLVGLTDASARAVMQLRGIPNRCSVVVPGWRGVLRESVVAPYVGGWSIVGREPLEQGSLLPSLNDCLPYHYPHRLGLEESAALDFSRLALEQSRRLLQALEEAFREAEGRLLSVRDLGVVVRVPRCPPLPEGFSPPPDRFPSDLVAEDIEALARLHPESHVAHSKRWAGT
jgi:nicotinic acid mononucleotide adenylyltransferase